MMISRNFQFNAIMSTNLLPCFCIFHETKSREKQDLEKKTNKQAKNKKQTNKQKKPPIVQILIGIHSVRE